MILILVETGQKVMTYLKKTNIPNDSKSNNRLSVQFSLSGLSFLIINQSTQEVVFYTKKNYSQSRSPEELLIELTSIISEYSELQEEFCEVSVTYATTLYALVPTPLFDEKITSEYLKLNSKILATDFVAFDQLENQDITIVYIPYININNYLFDRYGNFKYYHASTLFLKYILNVEKHSIIPKLYINLGKDMFDILIIDKGELILCNSYEFKTPEDFIYYILFCLEQLKLNPETITCVLSGEIEEMDSNFNILFTYIRHISFIDTTELPIIKDIKSLAHHNLLLKLTQ